MFLPTFPLLKPIYIACLLTPKGRSFLGLKPTLPPPHLPDLLAARKRCHGEKEWASLG